jgi:hypothetical protein
MKNINHDPKKAESSENKSDDTKYKYHESQKENDKEHGDEYPDKPNNHTEPEDRLLNPDKGE